MSQLSFVIAGMSDEGEGNFAPEVLRSIAATRVFSGGKRHHELVRNLLPEGYTWIDITVPLSAVFDEYRRYNEPIFIFASGDPLFFGYTTTLMREFPGLVKKTYPYFNSLQMLCHALTLPYHDMRVTSLVGRPWLDFDKCMIERTRKLGVLTDKRNTPRVIAQRMLDYGYDKYRMHIGVRLGGEREEIYSLSLAEVKERDFEQPNCIILEATDELEYAAPLGLKESDFHLLNGRAKMITKRPIRLVSLSMMDLHRRRTFWDVGFCTGSVSVEAKLQFPHLNVRSFEIREEGEELMPANSKRFGTPGIEYHIGDFMETDVESFERPDAVFIGGHGGQMIPFVKKIVRYIQDNGVIVFNSVSAETLDLFREGVKEVGWVISEEMRLVVDDHNPITILKATKEA